MERDFVIQFKDILADFENELRERVSLES